MTYRPNPTVTRKTVNAAKRAKNFRVTEEIYQNGRTYVNLVLPNGKPTTREVKG